MRTRLVGFAFVALLLHPFLAACRTGRGATGGIEGALATTERVQLTPGATYRVRAFVRNGDTAVQIAGLQGPAAAIPVPFRLNWPLSDAGAGPVEIEAELLDAGRRWVLPTRVTVPARGERETMGLLLVPSR